MQALHNLPPLRLREMRDGVVIPAVGNCTAGLTHGGVVNAQGQIDPGSLLYRRSMRVVFPPETLPEAADTVEEPHIYAGFFIWHYGHFLLESLARLWATTRYPDMHIVWAGSEAPTRWQREICDMFGIGDRMRFVDRPTRFRRLIMPEPGIRLGDYAHPDHIRFLGIHGRSESRKTGPRLWLSRRLLDGKWRVDGEDILEDALEKRGWRAVAPETFSVREQLDMMEGAGAIAGIEGSALHTPLLLKGFNGPLIVVRRIHGMAYRTLSEAAGIEQHDLLDSIRFELRPSGAASRFQSPLRSAELIDEIANGHDARVIAETPLHPCDALQLTTYQDDNRLLAPDFRPFASLTPPGLRDSANLFARSFGQAVRRRLKIRPN